MKICLHIGKFKLHVVVLQPAVIVRVSTQFVDLMFICAIHAGNNNPHRLHKVRGFCASFFPPFYRKPI